VVDRGKSAQLSVKFASKARVNPSGASCVKPY
jgi:hypothetical protein